MTGKTGWDALPEEAKELARQGILGNVGTGRDGAQPAGWWAQRCNLDVAQAVRLLRLLESNRIVLSLGGSKFYFSEDGNGWAVELVEFWASEENPFGEPELLMIGRAAESALEVVEAAARLCPNLTFHANCQWYPKFCRHPAPFHELAQVFLVLDAMAHAAATTGLGIPMKKWVNRYCVEHGFGALMLKGHDRSTEKNSNRKVRLAGQDVFLEDHFSLGSSGAREECISIYFVRFPKNAATITIGYCGPHLPKD